MTEQEIFATAIRLNGEARVAFLSEACGADTQLRQQVEALLKAHEESGGIVPRQMGRDLDPTMIPEVSAPQQHVQPGTLIGGRYKLIEAIGEGGMGTVWMAEQKEPVKRKVAVKLVKAGMDSAQVLARFEAERQALALMDHPNIARVFDGGMTDQGRPYFVMELVKGVPITEYCDHLQMEVRERLILFNQLCSAVQHAHQKGIIHRDLKPANILITEYDGHPVCKVIDFGLARAIQGGLSLTETNLQTGYGVVVGTPLYIAPEQLKVSAHDVDTRADLYSLGVILYELLTGTTPIERGRLKDATWDEIRRMVSEEDAPAPSQRLSNSNTLAKIAAQRHVEAARLSKLVRGDLDWIVMKALEKDRNRRYETANAFGADVQRYLTGEAVLAAPVTRLYRLGKFTRRHRVYVVSASLLVLSLVGGILGTSYGLWRASLSTAAERTARVEAQNKEAEAVRAGREAETHKTAALKQKARAEANEQEAIDAVCRYSEAIRNNWELMNNPGLESLRNSLLQEPLEFFQSLSAQLESDASPESRFRLGNAAYEQGILTDEIGNKLDAQKALENARQIFSRLVRDYAHMPEYRHRLALIYLREGKLQQAIGKVDVAREAIQQALAIEQRLVREHPETQHFVFSLAECHAAMGTILSGGNPELAIDSLEEALLLQDSLADSSLFASTSQSRAASLRNQIGIMLPSMGRFEEALREYERALDVQQRLVRDHPSVADYRRGLSIQHSSLGNLCSFAGNLVEARKHFEQALEIQQRLTTEYPAVNSDQLQLSVIHMRLGGVLMKAGEFTDAQHAWEQAISLQERLLKRNPAVVAIQCSLLVSHQRLGDTLHTLQKDQASLQSLRRALEVAEQLPQGASGDALTDTYPAECHYRIGRLLRQMKQSAAAIESFNQALQSLERLSADNPESTRVLSIQAETHRNIGNELWSSGRRQEALQSIRKAGMILDRIVTEHPARISPRREFAVTLNDIGVLLNQTGDQEEALSTFERSLKVLQSIAADDPIKWKLEPVLAAANAGMGTSLMSLGKHSEALQAHEQALEIRQRLVSEHPASTQFQKDLAVSHEIMSVVFSRMGAHEKAQDACEQALRIRKSHADKSPSLEHERDLATAHTYTGNVLHSAGRPNEAMKEFEKTVEIMEHIIHEHPKETLLPRTLAGMLNGMALKDLEARRFADARDRLQRGIQYVQLAVTISPESQGDRRFRKFLLTNLRNAAIGLNDQELLNSTRKTLHQLAVSAPETKAMEDRLAAVRTGEAPGDNDELVKLGKHAYHTSRFALAAGFYAKALDADPALAENRQSLIAYDAACSAALAACGQSFDDAEPDETGKGKLRQQALMWLQSELLRWKALLDTPTAEQRALVIKTMKHWQEDSDLESVRDANQLATLPEHERTAFDALWKQVADVLAEASATGSGSSQP